MKAVRIDAYMGSAHFSIPTWKSRELTYPLPPYSTVIGMVHTLCSWNTYHDMQISVSGKGIPNQEVIKRLKGGQVVVTKTTEFEKRFPLNAPTENGYVGYTKVPVVSDFLVDVILRLHICPENQSEVFDIFEALSHPSVYLSLGRYEDLMRIDSVKIVDISDGKKKTLLDLHAYVQDSNFSGTKFKLHKNYVIQNDRRIFTDKIVTLVSAGVEIEAFTDADGYPVFFV